MAGSYGRASVTESRMPEGPLLQVSQGVRCVRMSFTEDQGRQWVDSTVVQVEKKILVLDQPFLQPGAVRRVELLEGLDGVHGSAFHLTHGNQTIRSKFDFSTNPCSER